jgi:hypothetical protein
VGLQETTSAWRGNSIDQLLYGIHDLLDAEKSHKGVQDKCEFCEFYLFIMIHYFIHTTMFIMHLYVFNYLFSFKFFPFFYACMCMLGIL